MSIQRLVLSFLALFAVVSRASAEPPRLLDLIPADACIGIGIRDLAELRTKSARLLPKDHGITPSQLLDLGIGYLNLKWKMEEKKPAALICTTGTLGGFAADADASNNFTIGAVLAPASLAAAAWSYGISVEELKTKGVHKVPGADLGPNIGTDQAGFRDGHLYLTNRAEATAAWMKAATLRSTLPVTRQRRLDGADGIVYFGPPLLRFARKDWNAQEVTPELYPQEAQAQRRLNRAWLEARQVLGGYRLDNGFGLDLSVAFDTRGTESQGLLKAITGMGRTSNLNGLPDSERLVGAFAAVGLERADLQLARVLVSDLWLGLRGSSPVLQSDVLLSDTFVIRPILGDLYSRLRMGRMAVYQTSDPARFGQLAVVGVLEPNDPDQFVKAILQYARLGDVEQFDPKAPASKAEIAKLVAELGSDDFETRESASAKLALIGQPAFAELEKARKADDAEVRHRAEELCRVITTAADLRKQELTKGLVKKAFRPRFTLKLNAEKQGDANVHLLGMRFAGQDARYAAALKDFFGPQWNRIRLAVAGKQVVVLLGSETALMDQALQNVRGGTPGLEQSKLLADFRKQAAPERRVELHLALSRVQALLTPAENLPKDFKATGTCSSVSLRTGLTDIGMDLWIPAEALADGIRWLR